MYVCYFFIYVYEGVVIDIKDSDIQFSIVYLIKKKYLYKRFYFGKILN